MTDPVIPGTVTLAGRAYAIAPLRFKDLKRILPLFLRLGIDSEARIDAQGEIVTAAIATVDPNFTRANFDDLSPTITELRLAVESVATLSGLEFRPARDVSPQGIQPRGVQPGEAQLGEAGPGEAWAAGSTGVISTADRHRLRLRLAPDR